MGCAQRAVLFALCLRCRCLTHHPDRGLDVGVVRALWMTPEELSASTERLRSPLVWDVVADYLAGQRYPLSLVRHLA